MEDNEQTAEIVGDINPTPEESTPVAEVKAPKQRRTRKPKDEPEIVQKSPAKKPRKTKKQEVTTEQIKGASMGIHALISIYAPKAMISESNAQAEAVAIKDVIDQYDMAWLAKYFPIVALAGTIAFAELPTMKAVREEQVSRQIKARERAKGSMPDDRQIQTIVPIRSGGEEQ